MSELISFAGLWTTSSGKTGAVVPHIGQGTIGESNKPAIVVCGWRTSI
ncbi:hypothetical protein [Maritalea porphyrae]|nr:hypothetical protein [Maritalea porphyrae]MCZ4274182.1 hypothetical protein [Maritalea porphyrae]